MASVLGQPQGIWMADVLLKRAFDKPESRLGYPGEMRAR